jgi:hypothetical protein
VARRAVADPDFAKTVLEGDEHPEVRDALIQDLWGADEVSGFLNPQPIPPGRGMPIGRWCPDWNGDIAPRWGGINFAATRSIIIVGG